MDQWENAAYYDNVYGTNEIHLMGDMNLDSINGRWLEPSYPLLSLATKVDSACNSGQYSQLVSSPTRFQFNRVTGETDYSCIDHIYSNSSFRCTNPQVLPFGGSDHDLISFTRLAKEPPKMGKTVVKRSYKNFNLEAFTLELSLVDWVDVYVCRDIDQAVEIFTQKFNEVLDNHAKWIIYQERKKFSPWISDETFKLIELRNQAKMKAANLAREGLDASEAWACFKRLRNQINNKTKFEERNFKLSLIEKSLDSSSCLWKTAKGLMGWKSSSGPPNQLNIDGRLVKKPIEIARLMNEFFINKVKSIQESIQFMPNNFDSCRSIMQNKNCNLSLQYVSVSTVNKLLKSLKNSRSSSIDGLDNYCVKVAADYIDKPLHHIITLSIQQKKFPLSWKMSKIIPLHKKNCQMDRQNYRPVSILSPLSKVLEKIIYQQMYSYFSRNKVFHPDMHGFRLNRSTNTALLSMYDRWIDAASKGQASGVVLLDLSAAFDLVDPRYLLQKLAIYGVDKDFLQWIESYLLERQQAVWINHIYSDLKYCEVGVPQGSNLGPLFFMVYLNDMLYMLDCSVDNYADDTTLSATGKTLGEIEQILNRNCEIVNMWMQENKLKLNATKTHILTVGTARKLSSLNVGVQVTMDNVMLEEDDEHTEKVLGCFISANLKWQDHFDFVKSKLKMRLQGLKQLSKIASLEVKKQIANGVFNSVLVYCLPLIGGTEKKNIKALQVLQNKAAQIVCQALPRTSRNELFDITGWMTVKQLISYHTLLTVFRIRSSGEPEYLESHLNKDTRNGRIQLPCFKIKLAQNSFRYRSIKWWNMMPENIRAATKVSSFKSLCGDWVLNNVSRFED